MQHHSTKTYMKKPFTYLKSAPQIPKVPISKAPKPFLKWAGGKGQLLTQLDQFLPIELEGREFTYIEPFVGGGAMLFHMLQKFLGSIRLLSMTSIRINRISSYFVSSK